LVDVFIAGRGHATALVSLERQGTKPSGPFAGAKKVPNTPASPEPENKNATVRERHDPLANTHRTRCPKGRNRRALRSGAIADFAIDPLERGIEDRAKRARIGSFPFV